MQETQPRERGISNFEPVKRNNERAKAVTLGRPEITIERFN